MAPLPRRQFAGKEVSVIGIKAEIPFPHPPNDLHTARAAHALGCDQLLTHAGVGCSPFGHAYGVRSTCPSHSLLGHAMIWLPAADARLMVADT